MMHIHPGNLNTNQPLNQTGSALAARQAENTRKKLLLAASELDATSSTESQWMITAWQGSGEHSTDQSGRSTIDPPPSAPQSRLKGETDQKIAGTQAGKPDSHRAASAGPVSYWA